MRAPVLVHGATGFTGKLVARALRKRRIPFAIAGRSAARLEALAATLGGEVETAVVDVTDPASLRAALEGRTLVCACAGPFVDIGEPVLATCAKLGVHYVDTTAEQKFVALAVGRYRATAEASSACIVPGMAYGIAPADWAAHLAAERLGFSVDSVDIVYFMRGARGGYGRATTRGTKSSAMQMLVDDDARQYVDGRLVRERPAEIVRSFATRSRGGEIVREVTAISFPSPEAVVVPSHTGAKTVRTFMAVGRATARALHGSRKVAPHLLRAAAPVLKRVIERSQEGPEGDARGASFVVLAEARRGDRVARVSLEGEDPYGLTADIQAVAAERALAGKFQAKGVVAPSVAFPPEDALRELSELARYAW